MTSPDHSGRHRLLKNTYGIDFPPDFFDFWRFAEENAALLTDAVVALHMTGPFDLLQNPDLAHDHNALWEARHYNDPPEFLTVVTGMTDGVHWGYYIDDPDAPPFPLATFYSNDAFELEVAGNNMFEVVRWKIEKCVEDLTGYMEDEPHEEEYYRIELAKLARLREILQTYSTGDRPETGTEYMRKYKTIDTSRYVVAPTRDRMGIVLNPDKYVPINGNDIFTQWDLSLSPSQVADLEKEAMDLMAQGYPGAALKLGKDLWAFKDYHETSYRLLHSAYKALGRPLLQKFLHIAIECRARSDSMSDLT
ncbi:hypothetical protein BDV59DRAFT_200738 [Aspergillus ambiguus]|uniref:uncharacterized protein n=1 Tax=Aspergillus ambiguus TaxID=176160 RepID=UPI003CCDB118